MPREGMVFPSSTILANTSPCRLGDMVSGMIFLLRQPFMLLCNISNNLICDKCFRSDFTQD